jgi:hypothetical protein
MLSAIFHPVHQLPHTSDFIYLPWREIVHFDKVFDTTTLDLSGQQQYCRDEVTSISTKSRYRADDVGQSLARNFFKDVLMYGGSGLPRLLVQRHEWR